MDYIHIKLQIESDYTALAQTRVIRGRSSNKEIYLNAVKALEELHKSVGPFITTKEQFIEHIKYLKGVVTPAVYTNILHYCKEKLKITI